MTTRAPRIGLSALALLMALAVALPQLNDWSVRSVWVERGSFPPLSAVWDPRVGPGTVPALVLAALAVRYAVDLAAALPWRRLLAATYAAGLGWMLSLALVDGGSGISSVLGRDNEYLGTARATTDVGAMLRGYVARIPVGAPDQLPEHPSGHPPGTVLFFVLLDRIGLGGSLAAGLVVTLLAASAAVAVLVTLRLLDAEEAARRAAPYLALGPAAVWLCVSADGLFTAVGAWGMTALAYAATRRSSPAAALAGLLLGACVFLSYGLPLLGLLAVAVIVAARSWRPLPVTLGAALLVAVAFAVAGFRWWEAFPVLHERYLASIARNRPGDYWVWADLAVLGFSAGPALGAGLGACLGAASVRSQRVVRLLVAGAASAILVADLSLMSKAEVERIWLPFVPWLLVSVALLPERWRRLGLVAQLVAALLVQHLLATAW